MGAYSEELKKLECRLGASSELFQRVREQSRPNRDFFSLLFRRQRQYLFWTISLMLLQICEIGVLAFVHYIFFPPESLSVLRVMSSLSFIGLLAALNSRFFKQPHGVPYRKDEHKMLLLVTARCLFLGGLAVSVALASYIAFFTTLHFSTPPIYRAVVLSGLIALPLDIFSSFLAYNFTRFGASPLRGRFRLYSFVCYVAALALLAYGMPAAYLITVLAPRVIFAAYLWRKVSGTSLIALLSVRLAPRSHYILWLRAFALNMLPSLALVCVLEASFFGEYSSIAHHEAELAFLLYFCHKIIHVAALLGIKTLLMLAPRVRMFARVSDRTALRRAFVLVLWASVFYSSLAMPLLGFSYLKLQVLSWASPTGELFNFGTEVVIGCMLLVYSRTAALIGASWVMHRARSYRTVVYAAAAALGAAVVCRSHTRILVSAYSVQDVFVRFAAVDVVCGAILLWWLAAPRKQPDRVPPIVLTKKRTLQQLIREIKSSIGANRPCNLVLVEICEQASRRIFDEDHERSLVKNSGDVTYNLLGTRHCLFMFRGGEFASWLETFLSANVAYISDVRWTACCESVEASFARLLGQDESIYDQLFALARGRKGSAIQITDADREFFTRMRVSTNATTQSGWLSEQVCYINYGDGARASSADMPKASEALLNYLALLADEEDSLGVWPAYAKTDGVVQLNRATRAKSVLYFEPGGRGRLLALRRLAFEHNLKELLNAA